jgi:hypothetical protein
MKSISTLAGLAAVLAFAICGSAASSASAALCLHVDRLDTRSAEGGKFADPECKKAGKLYVEATELGTELHTRLFCAKVKEGVYKDPGCSEAEAGGKYIRILLGEWLVTGTALATGATLALATTAKVDESTVLNVPSLGIQLTCTGGSNKVLTGTKPYIQGPDGGGAESLIFEGCSEIGPSGCTIETQVPTKPVVATVEYGANLEDRILFSPTTGHTFAEVEFKGTCALAGEKPVNGKAVLGGPSGQEELVAQPLAPLGTTENNSLEEGKQPAYLEKGRALITLATGKTWSFV